MIQKNVFLKRISSSCQTHLRATGLHCVVRARTCHPTLPVRLVLNLQWRIEGVRGVRTPIDVAKKFCWYFNHTECVKIQYFQPKN